MVTRGHSWSLVVTRGHSWSLVVTCGHSWSFVVLVVIRGHSCVLLDKTDFHVSQALKSGRTIVNILPLSLHYTLDLFHQCNRKYPHPQKWPSFRETLNSQEICCWIRQQNLNITFSVWKQSEN